MKLRLLAAILVAFTCATPSHAQVLPLTQRDAAGRGERLSAWTHPTFPVAEYVARRSRARALLDANDVLVVPGAEGTSSGETFRQLDNFEYLVGLEIPRSTLVIDGRSGLSLLFLPRTDPRFENPTRPNDFPGRPLIQDGAERR